MWDKRYNAQKEKFSGGFLLSQFEVVACGLGFNLHKGNKTPDIKEHAAKIWSDTGYINWSGTGITATRRLPKILPFGRKVFNGSD